MELFRKTAHEISDMIKKKEVSCVEVTNSVLDRIDKVESKIEAYNLVCNDYAIEQAKTLDKKVAAGQASGDLFGVPMGLKDNMCTDGIATTCSSKMLGNFIPPYDATVTKKLKEAGTVLLGKMNLDEFAMGSSTENSATKTTKNPWDIERVPGGSSGGSAAAVSADEAFFTLGSDTGGSIRQPASLCGCVGIKPTYGHVSRYGLVAFASSLDQIGSFTKDVTDCALVMNAISGHDPMDSTSANIDYPDYKKSLVNDVKGLKVGIPKEYYGAGINEEVRNTLYKSIEKLKEMGAEFEEFSLPLTEYALPAYYLIATPECSSNLARFDGIRYGYRTDKFSDLVDLYCKSRSEGFGPEVKRRIILGTYALSSGYYDAYYKKAMQVRTLVKNDFENAFKKYDVIITPTSPTTAFKIGEKSSNPLEMYAADICTVSVNIAGLPGMVVPCGFDSKNLPIGMQIIGKHFDEKTIIRTAYTFEQNTEFHKMKPSL